ncbi:DUF4398 domain-containing protein [Rheinheimera sp.]|uniref:DUF4398 domain-containing protein n=1 Tax=Rheinheimera sp. TaxID=1869214 RepID=UPI0027B9C9B1|nr:DUF4398 domain-containing protein [Rheinheimera sp.]
MKTRHVITDTSKPWQPLLLLAFLLFAIAACSAAPKVPTATMDRAERTISKAEQARVAQFAPAELASAREKMQGSRTALLNKDVELADRLALEASLDAELASARAELIQANNVNAEMTNSIGILKQEMLRLQPANPVQPAKAPWQQQPTSSPGVQS